MMRAFDSSGDSCSDRNANTTFNNKLEFILGDFCLEMDRRKDGFKLLVRSCPVGKVFARRCLPDGVLNGIIEAVQKVTFRARKQLTAV